MTFSSSSYISTNCTSPSHHPDFLSHSSTLPNTISMINLTSMDQGSTSIIAASFTRISSSTPAASNKPVRGQVQGHLVYLVGKG